MTPAAYIAAVRACPTVRINRHTVDVATMRPTDCAELVYIVGRRRGNRLAIVHAAALADAVWTADASYRSSPRRLAASGLISA